MTSSQSVLPPVGSLWRATKEGTTRTDADGRLPDYHVISPGDMVLVLEAVLPWLHVSVGGRTGWVFWGWLHSSAERVA